MLKVEVENQQEPKEGGGTIKEESAGVVSPPALQESAAPSSEKPHRCPQTRSRMDSSLVRLTQKFAELMRSSAFGLLDLNYACEILKVPKRRLYDVVNVLEGCHLVTKEMKNSVQWLGPVTNQDFAQELMDLQQKEMKLDKLIQNCTLQIYQLFENQHTQKFAYLTYEDLSRIPSYREQTMMVIKAPAGSHLVVPHPDESLCIHVISKDGPIEVFLCPEQPDSDNQKASANRNHAPPQAASPFNHTDAKDAGPVGSPRVQETRQPPAATSPSGQRLAEDQGISDLFYSVHMEQMPLDLPV